MNTVPAAAPSTVAAESAIDQTRRMFGEAITKFDPFRFRAWAELGLTTAQLRVIFLMRESPGVTAGELACRLSVTPPTISGIVDRLVKLSLVRRADDSQDRRLVRNFLTAEGEHVATRMEEGSGIFTTRIMEEMTETDLDALLKGLQAFIHASECVRKVEPNLAEMAMPGTKA